MGQNREALETLRQEMAVRGGDAADSNEWSVLGRLAEQYGETAAAAVAYRRVQPPEGDDRSGGESSWALAMKRLELIDREAKRGPARPATRK